MSAPTEPRNLVRSAGGRLLNGLAYIGGIWLLLKSAARQAPGALGGHKAAVGRRALAYQMVRVGVRSVGIVCLVQLFIGIILALQMAPPLKPWGQMDKIANIIGVAGFRMLGPIITAVVLSGFAGASIAAEIGTMKVAEEIEALEALALNPVRFLVVPRVLATLVMLVLLTVIADWMIAVGGYITARLVLEPGVYINYWKLMHDQLRLRDFLTGLTMSAVFGVLVSLIACFEGLKVKGGAEGVGRATTMTVVYSIVSIIGAACVFTVIFYVYGI